VGQCVILHVAAKCSWS